jgi:DNA-binding response OmpR family regulator
VKRILVIEDNVDLAYGLRNNLEIEGYEVALVEDGQDGIAHTRTWQPDLVILDLMLPTLDGYHVLRELRRDGYTDPILVLTARDQEVDKVRGLRWGADDYVTKPFGVMELLARIDALLRRATQGNAPAARGTRHEFGAVHVDQSARLVFRHGQPVSLTPMEFDLLIALLRRAGGAASRLELLQEVWGHQYEVLTRTVDTHVAELRRKLEDEPATPRHILTVRKFGYRLAIQPEVGPARR